MKIVVNRTKLQNAFLTKLARWTRKEMQVRDWTCPQLRLWNTVKSGFESRKDFQTSHGSGASIWVPKKLELAPKEFTYLLVCHLAQALKPIYGEMPEIRQPAGKAFLEHADELLVKWGPMYKPIDLNAKHKKKIEVADRAVLVWSRKLKLAQTKLKIWKRRQAIANRTLEKKKGV
jgi:hypothetical protein